MLSAALKNRLIEAAVVVCDGAGTVISKDPETVQGIGARMNTLIFTSPLKGVLKQLERAGCHIAFQDNTWIDQAGGVQKALSLGYKKIGVTVTASAADQLEQIRDLEKKAKAKVLLLAVCTSGTSGDKIDTLCRHADVVWTCASGEVREQAGLVARLQLSKQIPVYALTENGVAFAASYLEEPSLIRNLNVTKQYLVSQEPMGRPVGVGSPRRYIREEKLPVIAVNIPACLARAS